jgi:hypothetical protein
VPGGHNFNNYANVNLIVSTAVSQRVDAVWPGALVNTAMQKLRIVTCGISGGRTLTRPLRDARRFPSTRSYPVPRSSRTPRKFRILFLRSRASFCRAVPNPTVTIRNFCIAVG